MKFDATIRYEEKYLPTKRHRIPRIREVEETVQVELREVSRQDAPVAMVVSDYRCYLDDVGKEWFGLRDIAYLAIDGQLYSEKRDMHGALDRGAYSMDDFLKALQRAGDCYFCWDDKSRDAVVASLNDFMDSHVLVDGVVHKKVGEPRYVVQTFGLGHNHGSTAMFIDTFYNENIGAKNYFNALQRDEAIAYATEVATRRGDTESLGRFEDKNIDVRMPEMVRCNPEKEHGSGNPLLNTFEEIAQDSDSMLEAGLLTMVATSAQILEKEQVSDVDKLIAGAEIRSKETEMEISTFDDKELI